MRVVAVWLSATLAWCCATPAYAGDSLLANGDFETPFKTVSDLYRSWSAWGLDVPQVAPGMTSETSNPHGGKACLRVHRPADPREWRGVLVTHPFNNAIETRDATRYTLSFWARSDRPGPMRVAVTSYSQLKPPVAGPQVLDRQFDVGAEWHEFQLSFVAGRDCYADEARHVHFAFFPAVGAGLEQDRTLWLDDVAVTAAAAATSGLINPKSLDVPPLPLRLEPGPTLDLRVLTAERLGPPNRLVGGLSISSLGRWQPAPFSKSGEYVLPEPLEQAVREMKLPLTRLYALEEDEPFGSAEAALDKTAWLLDRLGIPRETSMIELEGVHANTKLAPEAWRRAVTHARERKLGFRHWEIGNEVYVSIWNAGGKAFASATDYADHVIAVSRAIKQAQPDALVGISVEPSHIQWGNAVLRDAAGHYDYVCPHLYGFPKIDAGFEATVIGNNHQRLADALRLRALLKAYNPSRDVFIYDSEWGLHTAPPGSQAWQSARNADAVGTLYRAVRLLYYARENVVGGASGWTLFSGSGNPGFLVLAGDKPEQPSMLSCLHRLFNDRLGDELVAIDGTAPQYRDPARPADPEVPLTPAMASITKDGSRLELMVVNGSGTSDVPATIHLPDFTATRCDALLLHAADPNAPPLLVREQDFLRKLPATLAAGKVTFNLPARSVAFVTFTRTGSP
jgi:hypothetical protein